MLLPFTHDQFLDVFGSYNRALWPVALLLWLATVGVAFDYLRRRERASRWGAGLLALHWAWSGAVYHLLYFRTINPAAVVFGIAFLVQAVFFAWKGVVRSKLVFRAPHPRWAPLAAVLVAYALVYPGLGLLLGLEYPRMPLFGVPCPTAILTCGALMLVPQREARPASIIPILWSAVGGSAAFLLDVTADLALLVSGVALFVYVTSLARKHEEETD